MKRISGIVNYPFDAQTDSFFCAISSALLPVLGYTEEIPFWCVEKGRQCVHCGSCRKTNLQNHGLMLYHCLLSATGTAFCFDYPEDDEVSGHTLPGVDSGWRWEDGFIGDIMDLCGVTWRRLNPAEGKESILEAIKDSIDRGCPVPIRLVGRFAFGPDTAWSLVTGYDGDKLTGIDSYQHYLSEYAGYDGEEFILEDWYPHYLDALVMTGTKAPAVSFQAVLERIIRTLSNPSRENFRKEVFHLIDDAEERNAKFHAETLCLMAGVPIEARWHAAEAFCSQDNLLYRLHGDASMGERLARLFFSSYIEDGKDGTHSVCWKIWSLLDCGPETGYAAGPEGGRRLLDPHSREELKRLWQIVFDNDLAVLNGLREIASYSAPGIDGNPRKGL